MCPLDIKWWAVITAGYNTQKVNTKSYRVTAHLTFPDPKNENHENYRGNRGNYQVIRNQDGLVHKPGTIIFDLKPDYVQVHKAHLGW